MANRRRFTNTFKTSIILTHLRGEATIAELARKHQINENLIYRWKQQFLEAGERGFQSNTPDAHERALRDENERLKRLLAEKELELDIAKKVRGL